MRVRVLSGYDTPLEAACARIEELTAELNEQSRLLKAGCDEIERLRKALTAIASDLCSRSGQIDIAKKALAGEPWE